MPLRSPNGGKFFPPPSPPVDPCAFGLYSGSATATDLAPRACTPTNRRSKAVVTANATPATNPSLLHWIHASISCRTHQSCPCMFHWFHAFIPCRTHQSHHEVLFLVAFVGKGYGKPLMHRARIRGARPHPAPRMHPFFISSLIMSNIMQRDLLLARNLAHLHWVPRESNPCLRGFSHCDTVSCAPATVKYTVIETHINCVL